MSGEAEPKTDAGPSLFWLVYGQVAAMLGAFSLLVFLTHFFDLGFTGIVQDAFNGWVQYVRPIFGVPLQALVDLLPPELKFHVSTMMQDYAAVGVVLASSAIRIDGWQLEMSQLGLLVLLVVIWPIAPFFYWLSSSPDLKEFLAWIAPVIYLGLLFAANAWLV